jgi:hypothetical protein
MSAPVFIFAQDQAAPPAEEQAVPPAEDQAAPPAPAEEQPAPDQTQGAGDQQAQDQGGAQQTAGSPFISDNLVRLGALIDQQVSGGQASGTVSDFVLSADGMVEFVQVDLQGAGDQTASNLEAGSYLVPVNSFSVEGQNITLNIQDTSSLQPASNLSQAASGDSVLLSQLMQYQFSGGENAQGKIVDVVADLQSGQIQYVAFSSSGSETLGAGEQLQAAPYQNVWYNKTDRTVRVEGAQMESFTMDSWPTQLSGGESMGGTLGSGDTQSGQQDQAQGAAPAAEPGRYPGFRGRGTSFRRRGGSLG